jgi:hypothetical protein
MSAPQTETNQNLKPLQPNRGNIMLITRDRDDHGWSKDFRAKLKENGYAVDYLNDYRRRFSWPPGTVVLFKSPKITITEQEYIKFLSRAGFMVIVFTLQIPDDGVVRLLNETGAKDILPCFPANPNRLYELTDQSLLRIDRNQLLFSPGSNN